MQTSRIRLDGLVVGDPKSFDEFLAIEDQTFMGLRRVG